MSQRISIASFEFLVPKTLDKGMDSQQTKALSIPKNLNLKDPCVLVRIWYARPLDKEQSSASCSEFQRNDSTGWIIQRPMYEDEVFETFHADVVLRRDIEPIHSFPVFLRSSASVMCDVISIFFTGRTVGPTDELMAPFCTQRVATAIHYWLPSKSSRSKTCEI